MYIPKHYLRLKSPIGTHPAQSPRVASAPAYRAHLARAAEVRRANIEAGVECMTLPGEPAKAKHSVPLSIVEHEPIGQYKKSRKAKRDEPCGLAMALLIAAGGGMATLGIASALIFGLQMALGYLVRAMGG